MRDLPVQSLETWRDRWSKGLRPAPVWWWLLWCCSEPIGWLNRQGVPARDLEDLSQDILLSVVKHLPTFQHSGNRGAFRSWLRTIVCNRTTDYWRAADLPSQASGGSGATAALQQIEDPNSDLNRQWDEEHDHYVLNCLLDLVEEEFQPTTLAAFRRPAPHGARAAEAAQRTGPSR